jgi:hypothetical protein
VKGHLLVITSVVLFLAVMVTMNLNSAVWAKDDYRTDSKSSFSMSEMTNGDVKSQTNDNGDSQTNSQINRNPDASNNCDANSQCGKTIGNVMGTLNNIINASIP